MQDETRTTGEPDSPPGLGEQETVQGGAATGNAVPEMPPGSDPEATGGGLAEADLTQSAADNPA